MTLTIHVTQDDIDHGVAADCRRCPVARAVQRATGDDSLRAYVTVYRECPTEVEVCEVPGKVVDWITNFDSGNRAVIRPFTFTLTIPDTDPVAVKMRLAELELTARGD